MKKNLSFLLLFFLHVFFVRAQVITIITDTSDELTDTSNSVMKRDSSMKLTLAGTSKIDSLISYGYSFLGRRYRRGGVTTKGFDCSGYTMTVFKKFNIRLPHTSAGQGLVGIEVIRANIRKGDLLLFKGRNRRSRRIGHVGIVISNRGDPVRFIHSSTSEGVRIDRLDYEYYHKRFVKVVRMPELYR